jgi:hypothetical protein
VKSSNKVTQTLDSQLVLVVEYIWITQQEQSYSVYLDGIIEIESVEELPNDLSEFLGIEDKFETRQILIEDVNKHFKSESLSMMPEESSDLFNLLEKEAIKVSKGVWRLNVDMV